MEMGGVREERICMVVSGVVLRTLATRGRKREAPRRQAWGDGAKRKVLRTIPLKTIPSIPSSPSAVKKKEDDQAGHPL